jgi:PAS domain S-box-containing protein
MRESNQLIPEEHFRKAVEGIRDYAIYMLDPSGCIISWNAGAERIKGYTADEVIGKPSSMFYPKADVAAGLPEQHLREAAVKGQIEEEGWRLRKGGKRHWAGVLTTAIFNDDGSLLGFSKVVRDLTRRRHAELERQRLMNELDRYNRELTERTEALEAFTYSVSHDLREPLRTIKAFSQFLQEDGAFLDDEAKDHLNRIVDAAGRLQTMVDQLLTYSGLGVAPKVVTSQDLGKLLQDIAESMTFAIELHHARLNISADLPTIQGERARLEQIFQNLLSNSLKFNRTRQPQVTIGLKSIDGRSATIYVRDNGIGMDDESLPRIFGMFERLQPRGEFEGTGAGLAIVKRAIESMGGSITVESAPGKGTTFYLTLPMEQATATEAA